MRGQSQTETMNYSKWEEALKLVEEEVEDLKTSGFEKLQRRPYCSELSASNEWFTYNLYVDMFSDTSLRVTVRVTNEKYKRTFAHGFEIYRNGEIKELTEMAFDQYQ